MTGMGLALVDAARLTGHEGGETSVDREAQAQVVAAAEALRARITATGGEGAWVTVGVVDITTARPRVIALASNAPSGGFFPAAVFEGEGWVQGQPAHALASMNKIALVIWAASRGFTQVCESGCTPLARVIAVSTPDIATLVREDEVGYGAFKAAFGYFGSPPGAYYDLATDSIEGSVIRVPPSQIIAGLGALYHGASDGPSIWNEQAIGKPVDLNAMGVDENERAAARALLAAPFTAEGTLHSYPGHATPAGCSLVLGKSGTVAMGVVNVERGAIVVHQCGDRLFATFVLAAHPGGLPGLQQSDLAPLHRAAAGCDRGVEHHLDPGTVVAREHTSAVDETQTGQRPAAVRRAQQQQVGLLGRVGAGNS